MSKITHAAALKRAGLPTLETLTRRILRVFADATPSDLEAGARWYDEAGQLATELAPHVGESVENAAAVIAALSPRTTWSRNVAGATLLCREDVAMAGLIGRNIETARRCMVDGFAGLGNGPKTNAFARNIAGDREAVTVDVWAARVAGVDESKLSRVGVYDAVAHAYRLAARRRGVDPATMQATTWVVGRGGRAN